MSSATAACAMTYRCGPAVEGKGKFRLCQNGPAAHLGTAGVIAVCIGCKQLLRQAFELEQVDISHAVDHGQRVRLLHADRKAMAMLRGARPQSCRKLRSEGHKAELAGC